MVIYNRITYSALSHQTPKLDKRVFPYLELVEPTSEIEKRIGKNVDKISTLFEIAGIKTRKKLEKVHVLEGGRPQPYPFQLKWLLRDLHTFLSFTMLDSKVVYYYDLSKSDKPEKVEPREHLRNLRKRLRITVKDDFQEIERDLKKYGPLKADRWTDVHTYDCEIDRWMNPDPSPPSWS